MVTNDNAFLLLSGTYLVKLPQIIVKDQVTHKRRHSCLIITRLKIASIILLLFKATQTFTGFFSNFRARQKGYRVHCGRWLVEGNPQVVLFDIASASQRMNEFKQDLYDKAGIGIPHEDVETNDVTIFGYYF